MRKFALTTGALALAFMVTPALAQDDDDGDTHAQAHQEHRGVHRAQAADHEQAHEDGFYSRRQHRTYHRGVANQHHEFHDEHPNTRHDHRRWWSYR